jgi:pimeloyl-ACP methyl ester carboxylesterase
LNAPPIWPPGFPLARGVRGPRGSKQPAPFVDDVGRPLAGSISEKVFVDVNGVRQGMFVRGRDVENPVLLYLHGGLPEYFLARKYRSGLEDLFTVAWWEQRGSGLSYNPNAPRRTMTLAQMISDTAAVTGYLCRRFGREKIYLMGHSGGTFIGIQAAAEAPQSYHAYIGVAQMTDQLRSERLAYEYMLQQFRAQGDRRMVRRLERAPVTMEDGATRGYLRLRDPAMHPLGIGTTHDMKSVVTGILWPIVRSPDYSTREKIALFRGKAAGGVSPLWGEMTSTDLAKRVTNLALPVYFFSGVHDYTVNHALAKEYLAQLRAPLKGFYTFEHSAHCPLFEEPQKGQRILREDVLAGTNHLADPE